MVHLRGRNESRRRSRGRRRAATWTAVIAGLGLLISPAAARAQAVVGFHGGGAVDQRYPEQAFGGVFFQTPDLGRGFRLRVGVDGATGDRFRIGTVGVDFVYGVPLNGGWTLIAGGGPAIVITRIANTPIRNTGVGFHSSVALGHDSGFFSEIRLGSGDAQQLKFGVGWAIRFN